MSAISVVPSVVSGVLGLAGIVFGAIATRNAQQSKNAADREERKRDIYARFLGGLHQAELTGIRPRSLGTQEQENAENYERTAALMVLSAEVDLIAPWHVTQLASYAILTVINHWGETSPDARQAVTTAIINITDTMRADLDGQQAAQPWISLMAAPRIG